jgi:GTP-binding protein
LYNIIKKKIDSHIAAYKKQLHANNWEEIPPYFVTSATEIIGKDALLSYIEGINEMVYKDINSF